MDEVRKYVEAWLRDERQYTLDKFGLEQDNEHVGINHFGVDQDGWWDRQFDNYLHRAKVLSLYTPAGRQAAAKFVATAVGFLEAVVRVHGPLPEPGVPSGENIDQLRLL